MSGRLPDGFAQLEVYVDEWALPTELTRRDKRVLSSMDQHEAFYAAMRDAWPDVSEYLKNAPADNLSKEAETLLHLSMMSMESGIAVVLFKRPDSPLAIDHHRLSFLHDN